MDIIGLPEVNNANAKERVTKLISVGLGEEFDADEIEDCYVKKMKTKETTITNVASNIVCVKFSSLARKEKIMNKLRRNKIILSTNIFNDKCTNIGNKSETISSSSRIFINDSLTGYTRSLFVKAKQLKINKLCKYVWVRNSSVLIRKKEGDRVIKVVSLEDLSKLNI